MGTVSRLSVAIYQSKRSWWSQTLLKYGLIDKPLDDEDNSKPKRHDINCKSQSVARNQNNHHHHKKGRHDGSGSSSSSPSDEEPDIDYLKSLCPTKWKEQDHYAVLGLSKKRFFATEEDVRRRYRKMLLKHHPDKRSASTGEIINNDDDYFACITKAFEVLGDPVKRRSYDSIDPTFDDDVPSVSNFNKKNFFEIFGPVLERNARWSTQQPVPLLGSTDSTREEVDEFYRFWYHEFDSWREYSYQDEEDKEKGEDRYERKAIELENRKVRQKKKKEEVARIRSLVDNAYACDPRVSKFKEDEKKAREEEKRKKAELRRRQQEEEEQRKREEIEAAELERQRQEEEARQRKELEKKEKEVVKKQKKKVRKAIEGVIESAGYFESSQYTKVQALVDLEKLFQSLSMDDLTNFKDQLESATDDTSRKSVFFSRVEQLDGAEDNAHLQNGHSSSTRLDKNSNVNSTPSSTSSKTWSVDDCFLLTKAAKVFPPGTTDRWNVITAYFNQHTTGVTRKTKDVMAKIKELQNPTASNLKEASKSTAADKVIGGKDAANIQISAAPSERYDDDTTPSPSVAATKGTSSKTTPEMDTNSKTTVPWTSEEQKLLEQALITFGKDTPKRWDRIAESIPGRTKQQCIDRFKELAELVKAKKEAMKAAGVKK